MYYFFAVFIFEKVLDKVSKSKVNGIVIDIVNGILYYIIELEFI